MHSRFTRWMLFAGLWLAVGFILSAEIYFTVRVTSPGAQFFELAVWPFTRVTIWAMLIPLILSLRRWVPLSSGRWIGGLSFHLAVSLLVLTGTYLARVCYMMVHRGEPWSDFWFMAQRQFHGRNLIDIAFYWIVIGFGYSLELHRRYRHEQVKAAQLESRLLETELKALKQQIHPHFLFNTMNTIAVLVREQRNDEAVSLLAQLSTLLRISLDSGREQEVTLQQEMEFLRRYIGIQQVRFADRLSVRTQITPAALEARIPNLLLQPIVENAILHGVAAKAGPGLVEINGEVRDGLLHLEVRDDGPGSGTANGGPPREGIGLGNTRERLAKLYGARGQLVLRSEPGRGTTVKILLPWRN